MPGLIDAHGHVMGLGLGGTATVYSLVNALILRPLPLAEPQRLVWVANVADDGVSLWHVQGNHLRDLREQSQTFADLGGYYAYTAAGDLRVGGADGTERLSGTPVTYNFFTVLGVAPVLGRTFSAEEATGTGPSLVMISHRLWQQRYGLDPEIIGRTITLNDTPYEVVGVLGQGPADNIQHRLYVRRRACDYS